MAQHIIIRIIKKDHIGQKFTQKQCQLTNTFFTRNNIMIKELDVKIPQHEEGNPAENSLGGTELVTMELFRRLPQKYKDTFQIIVSRIMKIDENKPKLYWLHDLALDPAHSLLKDSKSLDIFE